MLYALFIIKKIFAIYLDLLRASLAMRIILSGIPSFSGGMLVRFCYALTEMYLMPIRGLIKRKRLFLETNLDFSNIIFSFLLSVAIVFLYYWEL